MARGTFYNHFKTTHELLAAVTGQLSDEVLSVLDQEVLRFDDPAVRICVGTRLYVLIAIRYPVWALFSPASVRGTRCAANFSTSI
ncbi:MAG: hypothetical protein V4754_13885 [Pseudomonadota bacterium]